MIPARCIRALACLPLIWCLTAASLSVSQPEDAGFSSSLPVSKPEDVGISSERLQRIHEMVMRYVDAHEISGAVTLVARRGRIVHFEAHGLMDIDTKKPMTKDALFRLASNSKPVTAAAVMILFEEGKLRLTDPVSKFIPEFRDSKVAVAYEHPPIPTSASSPAAASRYYTVPATRDITILDLLTHTSGLASGGITNTDYQQIMRSRKPTDTLADIIPQLGALPLDFQPGSQWHYSPTGGFDTLGRIVEIASGMSFDRFLRERLFEPLDMRDTGFNVPESDAARLVTIYRRTETGLEKTRNSAVIAHHSYFSGAAGLTSTAEDYYKFFQMLCNGGILNGKRILSPWTVDLSSATKSAIYSAERWAGRQRGLVSDWAAKSW